MGPDNDDSGAIDVAALMAQVRLEVPHGTVTVQGIVVESRPWAKDPTIAFGELRGFDGSTISFKCPVAAALRKEDHAVLRGTLNAYKSKKHRGFDLLLEGTRVGSWPPSEPPAIYQLPLERTRAKLTLQRFLFQNAINNLALIGTDVGISDAKQALLDNEKISVKSSQIQKVDSLQFGQEQICSTAVDSLLPVLVAAAEKYDGLCLVRGGGDPSSFSTWNDRRVIDALILSGKPFYTALGHTHDVTLADMHADESFGTPSILGAACRDAWKARSEQEQKDRSLKDLRLENEQLRRAKKDVSRAEWDRKILLLQTTLDQFQKLPSWLRIQTGQAVTDAIRASMQEDFKRPLTEAIQGPIANLMHVTEQARGVLTGTIRELRLHVWTWLASVFLLGVFAGAYGLYSLERSTTFGMRHEGTGTQQPLPSTTKPSEARAGSGHRGR